MNEERRIICLEIKDLGNSENDLMSLDSPCYKLTESILREVREYQDRTIHECMKYLRENSVSEKMIDNCRARIKAYMEQKDDEDVGDTNLETAKPPMWF